CGGETMGAERRQHCFSDDVARMERSGMRERPRIALRSIRATILDPSSREARVSEPVTLRRDGNVGVVTVDNPPVNAIKTAVRVGLIAKLNEAKADPGIAAVVLACAGRTFMAGAPTPEFRQPLHRAPPRAALRARPPLGPTAG